jgi:SAM-dependent methyltransferase
MKVNKQENYIPALGFNFLTHLFDPLLALTMPERKFKQALIDQAAIEFNPDLSILDFGCGTATLTIMIKQACKRNYVCGVDVDPKVLAIAKRNIGRSKLQIELSQYNGLTLPYQSNTFDLVLSSLVFHHLSSQQKGKALQEIYRVLKMGGELHVADWGKAQNSPMRRAFYLVQLLDGFENTADHVKGLLPAYIENAGFSSVEETRQYTTLFGSLSLYIAKKM